MLIPRNPSGKLFDIRFKTIWNPKLVGTIKQMKFRDIDPEGFAV